MLEEGGIAAEAVLALISRPHPEWTLMTANQVMHHRKQDWQAAAALSECPPLSQT